MKLELATKDYTKAKRTPARLIAAVSEAIDSLAPEWEKIITAICAALIEDFGSEIAEDLGGELKYKLIACPKCGGERLSSDGDGYVCIKCQEKFTPEYKWVFDPMSAAVLAWITEHGAESVTSILATNLDDVKFIIMAGVEDGLTTPQIGNNIRKFYTDRSAFKAMRIARTETSRAAGFGQREAARQSGVVKTKTWISSRDDRVRDEHVALDTGDPIAFNKPYPNGEMYPGENSISCRCAESYGT